LLLIDYEADGELTTFTELDLEDFYETSLSLFSQKVKIIKQTTE